MDKADYFDLGLEKRKKVLGAAHVERSWESADEFNRPIQQFATEYCWGKIWNDDTLSDKMRSMLNIGMLIAMSQHHELAVHVRGALNNGVSKDEIRAVIMQASVYCGLPLGLAAARIASQVFKERENS